MICTPKDNETTEVFLARRGNGKNMLLINVIINGELTSAWENTTDNGAWRDKNGNKGSGKLIDHSNINICCNTMSLSRGDLEKLAKELAELSRLLPATPIGDIRRSSPEALDVLDQLMNGGVEIIRKSVEQDLTTELFLKRRELGKYVNLLIDGELSKYAREVLNSFKKSQRFYAELPELSSFTGDKRTSEDPSDKGGKIRASIKALNGIDISSEIHLDFVEYELKPLRISQIVGWTAQLDGHDNVDPRKDSMDILLSCDKLPVHTEVKAQGDSYCSSALVQIFYYGCVLANERQRRRLCGQFPQLDDSPAWLAVIAEERGEEKERGFDEDRIMTVNFLQHQETQEALRPFFYGVFIMVVRKNPDSTYSVIEEQTNMIVFGD